MSSSTDGTLTGQYVGRFAPSPTGPLHFGSLVTALASFLDARHHDGRWLLRIEDLDPPRESPDAPARIMSQLDAHGLHWDGDVLFQSQQLSAYDLNLTHLRERGLTFPCKCSRKSIRGVYPGTCRSRHFENTDPPYAERLLTRGPPVGFDDLILGRHTFQADKDFGDFIVRRKDGLTAYQLAVVVDDEFQGVTHVVRGSDLLTSTPMQVVLARLLHFRTPQYAHIPVVLGSTGDKLSKQTHAPPVEETSALSTLRLALQVLGQPESPGTSVESLLSDAITSWDITRVPRSSFLM